MKNQELKNSEISEKLAEIRSVVENTRVRGQYQEILTGLPVAEFLSTYGYDYKVPKKNKTKNIKDED